SPPLPGDTKSPISLPVLPSKRTTLLVSRLLTNRSAAHAVPGTQRAAAASIASRWKIPGFILSPDKNRVIAPRTPPRRRSEGAWLSDATGALWAEVRCEEKDGGGGPDEERSPRLNVHRSCCFFL